VTAREREYLINRLALDAYNCRARATLARSYGDKDGEQIYLSAEQSFARLMQRVGEENGDAEES